MYAEPAIPAPPATINAPVVVEILEVVLDARKPPASIVPAVPVNTPAAVLELTMYFK